MRAAREGDCPFNLPGSGIVTSIHAMPFRKFFDKSLIAKWFKANPDVGSFEAGSTPEKVAQRSFIVKHTLHASGV
jgi:hypothetical protein